MVAPIQIGEGPVMAMTGFPFTVTTPVAFETQPCGVVKVNWTEPLDKPVTTPLLSTDATEGLRLAHVPPPAGLSCVV